MMRRPSLFVVSILLASLMGCVDGQRTAPGGTVAVPKPPASKTPEKASSTCPPGQIKLEGYQRCFRTLSALGEAPGSSKN